MRFSFFQIQKVLYVSRLFRLLPITFFTVTVLAELGITDSNAAEATTVRVGTSNSSSDVAFFIADKKGYFKQEGLSITLTPFDSAARMVAPLGADQLDVGGGAPSAGLYNAVARGINIKIVADKGSSPPGYGYNPLLVRKDLVDSGKFKGFKDLKGLKVAAPAMGTSPDAILNEALKKGGLKYSDVEVVYMGFPQHVLALQNGAVEASVTTEPSATRAVQSGAAVRFQNDAIYPNQQIAVVLYGGKFIKDNPETAKKFMRAYIKAIRDYNDALKDGRIAGQNADEIIAILTEYTPVKDPNVYKTIVPNGCNPDGKVNEASLKKDFEFYKSRGLIEGNVTVEQALDSSFADAVVKELGPYKPKG
jgi:NitT/TauT family transport system substrate-binding protein